MGGNKVTFEAGSGITFQKLSLLSVIRVYASDLLPVAVLDKIPDSSSWQRHQLDNHTVYGVIDLIYLARDPRRRSSHEH